jgi:3-hydroxyisobutyrate dehydrogenase-like beta-hydroxyacid dehydrogenase
MGLGMAMNLQRHMSNTGGPDVKFFNRTISRGAPLQDIGGSPASSVADLVANTDIIFMSLSDDAALNSTIDLMTAEDANLSGKLIVDTTTVHPTTTGAAQQRVSERGASFLAAPVFGASPVAAQGQLLWILAGPESAVQAVTPFITGVMGRGIIRLGEDVRQATIMKTAG